jgi:hypothetical protein
VGLRRLAERRVRAPELDHLIGAADVLAERERGAVRRVAIGTAGESAVEIDLEERPVPGPAVGGEWVHTGVDVHAPQEALLDGRKELGHAERDPHPFRRVAADAGHDGDALTRAAGEPAPDDGHHVPGGDL